MPDAAGEGLGLRSRNWLLSYRTSSTLVDGRPVNILHDFYIPALSLAVSYDRVAGYFRSSSLAVASQGFSAFVGRGGRMRLIVGADLDPEDVRAILRGNRQRLEGKLNAELERSESWPQAVKNGVALLGWMVKEGYLEVRVSFRVNGETGEPIPFESTEDGYVHEKWFVLTDEFGNRLYGSGTLNESKTALVLNAENIDIHCDWWGETDRRRIDDAVGAFERLWNDQVRHLRVMTLPEAVRQKLIRLAEEAGRPLEIDGTSAVPRPVAPPSALERLQFAVVRDAPKMPGGRFVGMETAPVSPWPHQDIVVRRLVETWPYSYLLCDEVGLGKTIEAGLAFRSLYLSGLARRILIVAPPGIIVQWQRQMASKMLMSFGLARTAPQEAHEYIFPEKISKRARSLFEPDLVILSTGLLARAEWAQRLRDAIPFDVVLIDEAHALRRRNPSQGVWAHPDYGHLYHNVREYVRKKARSLWLATATPMQIDPVEVCDLMALTNRVGSFQYDPVLTIQYFAVLGKILKEQEPTVEEWEFLRRAVKSLMVLDPLLWQYLEETVIDRRLRSITSEWFEHQRIPRGRDRQLILKLLRMASPLSRVMLRHTRRLLEVYRDKGRLKEKLPRRHIMRMPEISFNEQERRAYESLQEYCEGLNALFKQHAGPEDVQMVRFLQSFLRLRFASSLHAIRETLRRRLLKVEATIKHQALGETDEVSALEEAVFESEDESDLAAVGALLKNRSPEDLEWERRKLEEMLENLADISGPSSKMQVLLRQLDQRMDPVSGRIKQTVVFTRFYDTLVDILGRLRQVKPDVRVGTYSGQGAEYFDPEQQRMIAVDREEVKERFLRGDIDVLICTDAAAEGLNLQTADLVVNFDLGWNPMKVEQRIGRIDRIGQQHDDIYVLNLCYAGSEEAKVYGRLLSRLWQANMVVGSQPISLLPVEPEDFRKLAEGAMTSEELEEKALERLRIQLERAQTMEVDAEELYEAYVRMASEGIRRSSPITLDDIWEALTGSEHLRELGCQLLDDASKQVLRVSGIDGIPEGSLLTASRDLYEQGLEGMENRVHFASYGDPYFEAILDHFSGFGLPKCARRIALNIPGLDGAEVIGYAVIAKGTDRLRQIRLVAQWEDLKNIQLAETDELTDEDIEPLKQQFEEIARAEFVHYHIAARAERDNVRAAIAQEVLTLVLAMSLIRARAGVRGKDTQFTQLIKELGALFEDANRLPVHDLPSHLLEPIAAELHLFDVRIPRVGETASMDVPNILGRSVVGAANRLADALKMRRSEITVGTILERLDRELQSRLDSLRA